MSFIYTTQMNHFLSQQEATKRSLTDVKNEFNKTFNTQQSYQAIKCALRQRNIVVGGDKGIKAGRYLLLTDPQAQWVKQQYKIHPSTQLVQILNMVFGTNLSHNQLKAFVKNHKIKSTRTGQFKKGMTSWNKDTKGIAKANKGSFQKGNTPYNTAKIGATAMLSGYQYEKIAQPNEWKPSHHILWEKHHKTIKPNHMIRFKNGDPTDIQISNLEQVSKTENAHLNMLKYNQTPEQFKPTLKLQAQIKSKLSEINKGKNTEPKAQH